MHEVGNTPTARLRLQYREGGKLVAVDALLGVFGARTSVDFGVFGTYRGSVVTALGIVEIPIATERWLFQDPFPTLLVGANYRWPQNEHTHFYPSVTVLMGGTNGYLLVQELRFGGEGTPNQKPGQPEVSFGLGLRMRWVGATLDFMTAEVHTTLRWGAKTPGP